MAHAPAVETADLHTSAVRPLVRVLCDARIAALVATVVLVLMDTGGAGVVLILLAAPFSWFPLRYWDERGAEIVRSRILLGCDVAMTLVVTMVVRADSQQLFTYLVYLVLSLVLWGVVLSGRAAAGLLVVCVVVLALWDWLLSLASSGELVLRAGVLLAVVWIGHRLGATTRSQADGALGLVQEKAGQAAAQERAHLAREMHDSLAKTVHGVSLLAQALTADLQRDGSAHVVRAEQIRLACEEALTDTREILSGLRVLSYDSLAVAVRLEATRAQESSGLSIAQTIHEDPDAQVDAETAWAVVRILGELLANVAKHADASSAGVRLDVGADEVHLCVTDDGKGMSAPGGRILPSRLAVGGHYGLIGVQERVTALGGAVRIGPGPAAGAGTSVEVRLPARAGADRAVKETP